MIQRIKLSNLSPNSGQIEGLPANPRLIKDDKFEKLKKSLKDYPEMLELRELLVFKWGEEYVIIGGNMRYRAAVDLDIEELPCKIIPPETPIEKLKAYVMKDNIAYGDYDWDMLANDWDSEELDDWGLDVWQDEDNGSGDGSGDSGKPVNGSLADRFVVPPFSILDTRKGYWQARKKVWRDIIGDMGEPQRHADNLPAPNEIPRTFTIRHGNTVSRWGCRSRNTSTSTFPEEVKERGAAKGTRTFRYSTLVPVGDMLPLVHTCCRSKDIRLFCGRHPERVGLRTVWL